MKKWYVSDIRWATQGDLDLPLWKRWNTENPTPSNFWQRIWEYPYLVSKIPKYSYSIDVGGTYPFVLFNNFPNAISVDNRDLDKLDHKLHKNLWPKEKLIIADASDIPAENSSFSYSFSISAIEEMPHTMEVLKEMIRISKHRVVITMDVSDKLGVSYSKLKNLSDFLGVDIPAIPNDVLTSTSPVLKKFSQNTQEELKDIRVLAFTLDSLNIKKSISILIPHWNSWEFLSTCIDSIKKYQNNSLAQTIHVLDDASDDGSYEKALKKYGKDSSVIIHRINRSNRNEPDVGALLDQGLDFVEDQFVATIDADVFPINQNWLSFPIWLIENYNCSTVGVDTGLSTSYLNRTLGNTWWQPEDGYIPSAGIYDNNWFVVTNNFYRVMNTATAKVVSEQVGFSRNSNLEPNKYIKLLRAYIKDRRLIKYYKYLFSLRILRNILKKLESNRYPYFPGGEDNGVAANHFIDINKLGPKFNIPITSYIGLTPSDGAFGQNLCDLVFHFALSTRALSTERREVEKAGKAYKKWAKMFSSRKLSLKSETLKELIEASREFKPGGYDNSIPIDPYQNDYKYIDGLIKRYKK